VSVATPRCGIWLTVFCGVLAADRRSSPFRLLRCAQKIEVNERGIAVWLD
jgi:hypothetical protein